ncbi:MAG: aminoglycoside phosphotransferase [Thermoleophilia bacterium]|nr:aminoglycoside phosphotransferase [Thermoleophilia bacterium]
MGLTLPAALVAQWGSTPAGRAWLSQLPDLVDRASARWGLEPGEPYASGNVGLALRVQGAGDRPLVLKLNFPEPESEREADALAWWDGLGAVRLVAHDRGDRALLLERCEPGTTLQATHAEDAAFVVSAEVMRALQRPAPVDHGFRTLADAAAQWAVTVPERWERLGRPFERGLVDAACDAYRDLGADQRSADAVVLHGDLHGCNILDAGSGRWLAIDPKPLVGEPAFDACAVVRERLEDLLAAPDPAARARRRLDLVADLTGLDAERIRQWNVAHTLAWAFEGDRVLPAMVAGARAFAHA